MDNGQVFARGENVGNAFKTRCGEAADFPCFCNPDLDPPVECPYCGFARKGGKFLCVKDEQVVNFVDLDGDDKTCGCSASKRSGPTPNCMMPSTSANTCLLDLPDGTTRTFADGESLGDHLPNRCGSDFPCFCNPSAPEQIECPYCRFPSLSGELVCAPEGETASYRDLNGEDQTCFCLRIPNSSNAPQIVDCNASPKNQVEQIEDFADLLATCELGGKFFQRGENVGDSFITRCGTTSDFPCFCNPDLSPPVDCPYCGFALDEGALLCTKDGEVASFVDIDGQNKTCGCSAPMGSAPTPNCLMPATSTNTCILDLPNGTIRTFAEGESIEDYIPSRCGSEFPCFCNPSIPGQVECPYCRFPTFGGDLLCASDGEVVSYQDMENMNQTCSCEIPEGPDAESIINCNIPPVAPPLSRPNEFPVDKPPSPTARPTSAPVVPPTAPSGCTIKQPNGEISTVQNGESFGDLIQGVCGDSSEWPSFCNLDQTSSFNRQSNNVEYPYCIFQNTLSGDPVCARDNEQVAFADETGAQVGCSCALYVNRAQSTCFPVVAEPASGASTLSALLRMAIWLISSICIAQNILI
jgi:hypothetical protein